MPLYRIVPTTSAKERPCEVTGCTKPIAAYERHFANHLVVRYPESGKTFHTTRRYHVGCFVALSLGLITEVHAKKRKSTGDPAVDKARKSKVNRRNYVINQLLIADSDSKRAELAREYVALSTELKIDPKRTGKRDPKLRALLNSIMNPNYKPRPVEVLPGNEVQRRILELYYGSGWTPALISEELGIHRNTVYRIIREDRARAV